MFEIVNNKLPLNLVKNVIGLHDVHSYHTRQSKNSNFFFPFVSKALAQNQLAFRGTKFNNNLNDLSMICFKTQLKKSFLEVC